MRDELVDQIVDGRGVDIKHVQKFLAGGCRKLKNR